MKSSRQILKKLIAFSIPLILSGLLQHSCRSLASDNVPVLRHIDIAECTAPFVGTVFAVTSGMISNMVLEYKYPHPGSPLCNCRR